MWALCAVLGAEVWAAELSASRLQEEPRVARDPPDSVRPSARAPVQMAVDELGASALLETGAEVAAAQDNHRGHHEHHAHAKLVHDRAHAGSHTHAHNHAHAGSHSHTHDHAPALNRSHTHGQAHAGSHPRHQGHDAPRRVKVDVEDPVEREADEILHDHGSERQWAKLRAVKRAAESLAEGREQAKIVEQKRELVAERKAELQRDLQKIAKLKEAEASMIAEIKENQHSLHSQLFGAEEAQAALAKADARAALEYSHRLKLIAYLVVAVALGGLVWGALQSTPGLQSSAWLVPFKKAEKDDASAASADATGAQHA